MNIEHVAAVDQAITSRHSVRAFLDKTVATSDIKDILQVASRAPSGTNTQPWKVYVVTGNKRREMIDRVVAAQLEIYESPEITNQYHETFA